MKNGLFDENEMRRFPSDREVEEYALEIAEDFSPKKSFDDNVYKLIWFNPYQLKLLIHYARTGHKKRIENPENFQFEIKVTCKEKRKKYADLLPEEMQDWINKQKNTNIKNK